MARLCAGCGYDAPADFAFCPKCGKPLAASLPRDEESDRRPVTVLFADLCDFTTLAEALDAEEVRGLQTALLMELSACVERYAGFVEKYVGDAVMAVFGAPVAHEDDAERAVRAALAMHGRVADLSVRWQPRLLRPLALHVGLHSGPVVAGQLGLQHDAAYAVTGDTVNAASRLQNAAGPGQTFISDATCRLVQHAIRCEPLGALALKGKARPLQVYRVESVLAAPASARGLHEHGLTAPMIGRDSELAALLHAFERMRQGSTQWVRIVADAGCGKSRLVAEFAAALRAQSALAGASMCTAACSSLGERPYGVLASLLPEVQSLFDADESDALEPEQRRQRIQLAVQAEVGRRVDRGALVLVVEDLHWADAASIELLQFLLQRLPQQRLMLLATHRPQTEFDAMAGVDVAQTVLRLQPLTASNSASLLDALFGRAARTLPASLQQRLIEQAGGNPLFIEEIVRMLLADGSLSRVGERWVYRPQVAIPVPPTIHGLLLGRIDRLSVASRHAMQEAAVIGPRFAEDLLREVASDAAALSESLRTLLRAGLIVHDDGEYRFSHGLIHDVAYDNLLARRRSELHTCIGQVLERRCGGAPRQLQDLQALGHHFRLGHDKPRGARYLVLAGDWARRVYANADAIRHYELALQTQRECGDPDAQAFNVRERLADVMVPAGRIADAAGHYEALCSQSAQAGDDEARARLLRKLAVLCWETGERARALQCIESGLALMAQSPPHFERAKLYQERGQLAFRSGDNLGALQWSQRALDHIEALDPGVEDARREAALAKALSLNTMGAALARLNRLDEAVTQLEHCVAVAREAGLPQAECRALSNLGVLYSSRNPQRAIEASERGLHTAQRIGDLGLQSRLYANLAVAYCTLTNRCDDRGVGAAQSAIRIDRSTGQTDHLTVSLVVLAQIHQCHGDPHRALDYYREALALAEKSGEPQLLFPCYDGLATLYLDRDELAEAERYMGLAKDTCERAGLDPDALVVLPFLA